MENGRENGLAMHLAQAHLGIALGSSTVARIMFSNVVMVRAAMRSLKDGVAAHPVSSGRNAPRISQRCVGIESVVATTAAAALVGVISLGTVVGHAAVDFLGFPNSFQHCGDLDSLVVSKPLVLCGCAFSPTTFFIFGRSFAEAYGLSELWFVSLAAPCQELLDACSFSVWDERPAVLLAM